MVPFEVVAFYEQASVGVVIYFDNDGALHRLEGEVGRGVGEQGSDGAGEGVFTEEAFVVFLAFF